MVPVMEGKSKFDDATTAEWTRPQLSLLAALCRPPFHPILQENTMFDQCGLLFLIMGCLFIFTAVLLWKVGSLEQRCGRLSQVTADLTGNLQVTEQRNRGLNALVLTLRDKIVNDNKIIRRRKLENGSLQALRAKNEEQSTTIKQLLSEYEDGVNSI